MSPYRKIFYIHLLLVVVGAVLLFTADHPIFYWMSGFLIGFNAASAYFVHMREKFDAHVDEVLNKALDKAIDLKNRMLKAAELVRADAGELGGKLITPTEPCPRCGEPMHEIRLSQTGFDLGSQEDAEMPDDSDEVKCLTVCAKCGSFLEYDVNADKLAYLGNSPESAHEVFMKRNTKS